MEINEIEKLIKVIQYETLELQAALGKDRYETVVKEVKEILIRNGLNEFTKYQLLSHLAGISQLERIRV